MKALLLGDLSPTEITGPLFEKEDIDILFSDVQTLFHGNDINFVNVECALTESTQEICKIGSALKGPLKTADVLKKIGVNYCGLSNNHIFDFGVQGIKDTLAVLNQAGIQYTGFGKNYEDARRNLVIEKENEKISIIAVCEHEYSYALENRMGARPFDEFETLEDVRNAKAESNRVIVIYHGGKEHCKYPSPRLRRACHAMSRAGADVILCQHSHCVGCYEEYENCHILYGQGNFHFVWPGESAGWYNGLAVRYDTETHRIEFVPIIANEYGIALAVGKEKEKILEKFEARNAKLKNGEWQKGWHEFCEWRADAYKTIIKNACVDGNTWNDDEMFSHYLDCEAHTDVWRELFQTRNHTNEL